jgi:hypothetical protein
MNIYNNQMEVGILGRRCIEKDARPGKNAKGAIIFLFEFELINNKKRKKYVMALGGCRPK